MQCWPNILYITLVKNAISFLSLLLSVLLEVQGSNELSFNAEYDLSGLNTRSFLVPPHENLNEEKAYAVSSALMGAFLSQLSNEYANLLSDTAQSGFPLKDRLVRRYFTSPVSGDTLFYADLRIYSPVLVGRRYNRMLIIRPYDDEERPCILFTHGSNGNLQTWVTYYFLGVADMLFRGYAVAFYENWNSFQHISTLNGGDVVYKEWENANFGDSLVIYSDDNAIQRGHYLLYQYAKAAHNFMGEVAPAYSILPDQMFAAGHSAGGLSSMMLTFADEGNFNHELFLQIGDHQAKTFPELNLNKLPIRGVLCSGAGLHDPSVSGTHTGNYFSETDKNKVVMMIHGRNDPAANVNYGPGLWGNFVDTVKLMGPLSLHPIMTDLGIRNYSLINCIGVHGVHSYPYTSTDRGGRFQLVMLQNIPFTKLTDENFVKDTSLHQLLLFSQQIGMMCQAAASLFAIHLGGETITLASGIYSWITPDYKDPFDKDIYDWKYVPQECGIRGARVEYFNLRTSTGYGESKPSAAKSLKIYPVPAVNEVTITTEGIMLDSGYLSIVDLTGRQVLNTALNGREISISVGNWPRGLYICRWFTENMQEVSSGKLMLR